jgi:hypothetical protein
MIRRYFADPGTTQARESRVDRNLISAVGSQPRAVMSDWPVGNLQTLQRGESSHSFTRIGSKGWHLVCRLPSDCGHVHAQGSQAQETVRLEGAHLYSSHYEYTPLAGRFVSLILPKPHLTSSHQTRTQGCRSSFSVDAGIANDAFFPNERGTGARAM